MSTSEDFGTLAPDRASGLTRRDFVKTVGAAAAAGSSLLLPGARSVLADGPSGPKATAPAETAVGRFYKTLTDDQRKTICFPFDHAKRSEVQNNWAIVKPSIKRPQQAEQQALCKRDLQEPLQRGTATTASPGRWTATPAGSTTTTSPSSASRGRRSPSSGC